MEDKHKKILDRLESQCARREYCSSDMLKKAAELLEGDMEAAQEILGKLIAGGFVDDRRYAAAFARDKSSIAGWGAIKIRHSLMMKGIGEDTVREALCSLDEERSRQRMEKVIAVKRASLKDTPDLRLRLIRFAAGRGYPYDDAVSAIDRILHNKTTDK